MPLDSAHLEALNFYTVQLFTCLYISYFEAQAFIDADESERLFAVDGERTNVL